MLSTTNLDKTNATALRQTIWATTLAFFVPILAFIGHYGKSKPVLSIAVVAAYACLPNLIQTSATYGRVVFSGYSAGVVIVRFAAAIVSAVGAVRPQALYTGLFYRIMPFLTFNDLIQALKRLPKLFLPFPPRKNNFEFLLL